MIPPRRALPKPEPPPPIEYEVVDVVRLEMVLDTGLQLQFDMDKNRADHSWQDGETQIVLTLGERVIRIARNRILYYETHPAKDRRARKSPVLP